MCDSCGSKTKWWPLGTDKNRICNSEPLRGCVTHDRLYSNQDGGNVEWLKIVFACTEPLRCCVTSWSSSLKVRWRQCGMAQDHLCLCWTVERLRDLMIAFTQSKIAAMWNGSRSSLLVLSRWEVSWPHDRLCSKQDGGQGAPSAPG